MAISGPGGIRPSEGGQPLRKVDLPVKEHIELEGTKESLLLVIHALRSQPKGQVHTLYKDRVAELKREQKALDKIHKLLTDKPKGYEEKLHPYLLDGETIDHMEKALPLEMHIVHEKLKAVETARVLTENL